MSSNGRRLGVVMDPIASIVPYKDSTLAMLLAAQRHGYRISYMEMGDLSVIDGRAFATARDIEVRDDNDDWFTLGATETLAAWLPP